MSTRSVLLIRIGAVAGALIYTGLAIGNGLDRMVMDHPDLARYVPRIFAVNALGITAEARLTNAPGDAEVLAERLVARAPVEPSSTALLGAARYATGDLAGADRAFRVAGQLGWRVRLTQAYWRQQALAMGDYRVAALRLDALLRQQPELLHNPATVAPFDANPEARAALIDRLAMRPTWLGWYTGEMDAVPAPVLAQRLPNLVALADRGVILGCEAIANAERDLTAANFLREAATLRRRHCRKA